MHQHQWSETQIPNGAKAKKAHKLSDGAACACGLTAKAPSKPLTGWLKSLPKS